MFAGGTRARERIEAEAERWRICFLHGLEGMEPSVPELDQFLVPLLGEIRPTAVGPGWNVDLGR